MLASLQRENLIDMNREQLSKLLGQPDYSNAEMIVYKTPHKSQKSIFVIFFDKNERVIKTTFDDSDNDDFYNLDRN